MKRSSWVSWRMLARDAWWWVVWFVLIFLVLAMGPSIYPPSDPGWS